MDRVIAIGNYDIIYQIAKSLSKIKHKKYELYVLSSIIHGLNDSGIKFKFQQYAKRNENGKYALIDLFLPQFNIAPQIRNYAPNMIQKRK